MKLKLTYHRSSGPPADVVITTDATARLADLARELVEADPLERDRRRSERPMTLSVSAPGGGPRVTIPGERAVGECAIASGCDIAVVEADAPAPPGEAKAAAMMRIESGPDAGREFPLPAGSSVIGRDTSADIVLNDRFVSKRHARVDVGSTVEIVDLNSANGMTVDGVIVPRWAVVPGQQVLLGDSAISVRTLASAVPIPVREIVGGAIPFNRSPRVEVRYAEREHSRPAVPTEPSYQPFPWIMLMAPLIMATAMYFFIGPRALLFAILSPIMLFGNFVMSRGRTRRDHEKAVEKFEKQLAVLRDTLARETVAEQGVRQHEVPALSDVYHAGLERSPLLWTRRPEHWSFLHLRLGVGTLPSRNTIAAQGNVDDGIPEFTERLRALEDEFRDVVGVPVIEDLRLAGGLGVVGSGTDAADAVRGLILQVAGLHSPSEVVICALAGAAHTGELAWLAWLPHTSSPHSPIAGSHLANNVSSASQLLAQLEQIIEDRLGASTAPPPRGPLEGSLNASRTGGRLGAKEEAADGGDHADRPAIVVLITEDAPADRARLVQMSERAAEASVFPIWVSAEQENLPGVARTFIDTSEGLTCGRANFVRHGIVVQGVSLEGASLDHSRTFASALAPLADSGALVEDSSDLPRHVSMVTLLGDDVVESPEAVVERWAQNQSIHSRGAKVAPTHGRTSTLRALIGQSGVDAMHLDLRTQGPHALVGGTTGSGKSEFLQAWVLGMAAEYSPDRVTFLFVDYKGGAAFADCVHLPHCVGLVTDLSPHLVRRALTSLRAELHHREHMLNVKKAKDLLELEKRGDPESPPALILVIDEFAALATEVPEFVDGVVDIAQRGRSLGIHLIMATQRPAGVIKDNLRANTNLRVALRMADESDSTDVIGTAEAAAFDPSIPGRGIAKTGPGRVVPFQSAYAGGHTSDEPVKPGIEISPLGFGLQQPWERPDRGVAVGSIDATGPTDQQRLVSTITDASERAGIPAPRRPWLDELSRGYDLVLLGPRTDAELLLGVADLPDQQRQDVVAFSPDVDGNLAVYGTGGSGKSVVLRTLAASGGVTPRGGPVHVYGLDFAAGGLRMLEALPHVGSIVPGDDTERVVRLIRTLREIADQRARDYPAVNAGSIADYRRLTGKPDEPRIVLLVDGFPSFRDQWEVGAGRAEWYTAFLQLLQEGRALGIHVVFTADRPASVPGAVASSVPRRVVLRLAEDTMYAMLDVPSDVLTPTSPPGRAVIDGTETQVAILGGSGNVSDQSDAMGRLAQAMERQGARPAPPIKALPIEYAQQDLPDDVGGLPVLGISDARLEPIGFDPTGTIMISGGPQSGRSTALAALVTSLRRWDPDVYAVYFGNRRSGLGSVIDWDEHHVQAQEVADRARELAGQIGDITSDKYVIVVECLSDFSSMPTDSAVADLVKAVKRSDHLLIAESEAHTWNSGFPLFAEMKSNRRGLLLQPETHDGETLLRTGTPRVSRSEFPPGRGFWIAGGKVARVQMPLP